MTFGRIRIVVEWVVCGVAVVLGVLTLAVPEWIEDVFGADPDAGSGAAEWSIAAAGFALAAVAAVVARWDGRGLREARPAAT